MRIKLKQKDKFADETKKAFWDAHPHHLTDSTFKFTLDVWLLAKVQQLKPTKIIDLGCGSGKVRDFIRNSTHDSSIPWIGVDTRESAREAFSKKNCTFILSDLRNHLPKKILPMRFVICAEVLEHLKPLDSMTLLGNICKGLKLGGHLVITTPGPEDFELERDIKRFGHIWSPKLKGISRVAVMNSCKVIEAWDGRFFGDKIREPELLRQTEKKYGKGAKEIIKTISARYHPRIATALFSHIVTPPCSHVQCVIQKTGGKK